MSLDVHLFPTFPIIPQQNGVGNLIVLFLPPPGSVLSALPRLCVLDLSCNTLLAQDVDGFGQLAASLSHAVGLHALRLQACGLTADSLQGLGAIAAVLEIFCPLLVKIELLQEGFVGFGLSIAGCSPLVVLQVVRSATSPL